MIDSAKWGFNGSTDSPTITPSILVSSHGTMGPSGEYQLTPTCHSFITNGQIQFLADSQHPLAGQTVELPDWPLEP